MSAPADAPNNVLLRRGASVITRLLRFPRRRRVIPMPFSATQLAGGTLLAIAAVLACMLFVDAAGFALAKKLPDEVVYIFARISDLGKSGWFLTPLGAFILLAPILSIWLRRSAKLVLASLVVRASFLFLSIALPGLVIQVIKRAVGRARPSALGPFAYDPGSWKAAFNSLPSGHATTALSVAVAIGLLWPRSRVFLGIYAVLICLSRIVVSAHWTSDVVAGACLGTLGALLVRQWFAARGLAFGAGPDGIVRPFSGPSLRRIKNLAQAFVGP